MLGNIARKVSLAFFQRPVFSDTDPNDFFEQKDHRKILASLHVVRGTGTARGQLGLTQGHLKSLGLVDWHDAEPKVPKLLPALQAPESLVAAPPSQLMIETPLVLVIIFSMCLSRLTLGANLEWSAE
jgi:hypothetical protein